MIDDTQRALLRNIATTIGALAVRCIKDPIAMGSVSTIAVTLAALLSDENVDVAAFDAIHRAFSVLPHEETPELNQLFGGCLEVCSLVSQYDRETATQLSSDLYAMWQRHKEAHLN